MTTVFLIILFVIQIISFYFLALLYTKVSNFDNLEKKQRQLMAEMDDSIAAYLTELKDENDRLLDQLATRPEKVVVQSHKQTSNKVEAQKPENKTAPTFDVKTPVIPLNIALKSYGSPQKTAPEVEEKLEDVDERTRAIRLYEAGETIEEIAKILGKGRTEVELILKFR